MLHIINWNGEINDASVQFTKESIKLTKNKNNIKIYIYDSAGNKSTFAVKVGNDTNFSLHYNYDGESKLTAVTDEKGSQVVGYTYDTDGNLSGVAMDMAGGKMSSPRKKSNSMWNSSLQLMTGK